MFTIQSTRVDETALKAGMMDLRAGAFVCFEGWVRNRNDGRDVLRLEYECYEALALKEGARIVAEAAARFDVLGLRCVHRTGSLDIGELAVWVGVTAEHRGEAFEACQYVIDEIKHRVPIWKRETYSDGRSEWVECAHCAGHAAEDRRHA
ncbi:MAG: molybdenum cofactor biosynthesis protein MoaE [Verrucomicrobiales bacterium]|nr:molybdenum cofactor biosynthesis protein MoaE [Verrucomicrobiales bacterium]